MLVQRPDGQPEGFAFYHYEPSLIAAGVAVVVFILTTVLHFYQMFRTRVWFMIPFCIGGIFEIGGYIGRALSAREAPDYTLNPYIQQSLLLLVAPALLAASIYMELGRLVLMTHGDHAVFIKRTLLTKIFVLGDILSFMAQAGGGGMMSQSSLTSTGEKLVLAGLALQLLFFGLFVACGITFHYRLNLSPSPRSRTTPWKPHMWALYSVSLCIFVRCVVRFVEYAQGRDGWIIAHEWCLYVFDAGLMALAMGWVNWVHPSEVAGWIRGGLVVRKGIRMERMVPGMGPGDYDVVG